MLDQSLLQSHFIGRDGFRWWIGQIPPLSSMGKQISGGGWGNRFKVRIIGYHPYSEEELPNEDLPWAQCLIPTTAGSGAANVVTGVQLQQGDVVLGFFLDGDNAQIPVILATFGRTDSVPSLNYRSPFEGFTGFSDPVKKNSKLTSSIESNEVKDNSNPSPPSVTTAQADAISQKVGYQVFSENSAIGYQVPLANTVKNTRIDKIRSIVKNLLRKLKTLQGNIAAIGQTIRQAADKIVTLCNDLIGGMFDFLIKQLIKLLNEGLKLLYKLIFALVLAATGSPVAAHAAGVAAQQAMLIPVKALEEEFSCIAGKVIEKMKGLVFGILNTAIEEVDRFVSCVADQFAGTLLNTIIGVVEPLFEKPLAGVANLLQFFSDFNLGNILREGIGMLSEMGAGFGCDQSLDNYKGLVNEWTVGVGPSGSVSALTNSLVDTYTNVRDITNIISSGVDITSVQECFTKALEFASPPIINIFGGRGSGATAIPIFGNLVTNPDGNITASVIGVQLTNPGSGYAFPPFIEIVDDNEQGYGAVARAIINQNNEIESVYMVSEGENYSVGDIAEFSVLKVLVENGGSGYDDLTTVITDNLGNEYNYQIIDGRIYQVTPLNNIVDSLPTLSIESDEGFGAILRPVIGALKGSGNVPASPDANSNSTNLFTQQVQTSIDCPI
jgi:hypothetical protein